jgi:hypothetical protein
LKEPRKAIGPLISSVNEFDEARKRCPEAFTPGLIQTHKYLVKAYEGASNKRESLVWQKRLNALVHDLDDDFFGPVH